MKKIIPIVFALLASVHFVQADSKGSYDEFMQGAMIVYANEVPYSVANSTQFVEYLDIKWGSTRCAESCYQSGYQEAKMFITHRGIHGRN